MKKLSLLVAIILCVTIGGVYATWNYAQGSVTSQTKYFDGTTVITNKVVSTAKGTIAIDTSALNIVIDDTNNDHVAELNVSGSVRVTFTPASSGVDTDVAANGIKMQYAIGLTGSQVYEGANIFTVDSTVQAMGTTATKSFTIPAADIEELITLANITLPTASDYDEFKEALHSGAISITVSEVQ